MIPVEQTIFCNVKGNCLAAVWASLLHKNIEEVPNFVEQENDFEALQNFLRPFGFEYSNYVINGNRTMPDEIKNQYEFFTNELPAFGDVDGFYEATVYSPRFFDEEKYKTDPDYKPTCHAVIVDRNFNIVYDPNPMYKGVEKYPLADIIGYNGVIGVCLWRKQAGAV